MGRSVSKPRNCAAVCYRDVSYIGMTEPCDDDGQPIEDAEPEYDSCLGQHDWEMFEEWVTETAQKHWKSFTKCDKWIGGGRSEDHAILENSFAYIGISEYCGLAAIWIVSKNQLEEYNTYYLDEQKMANIADHWCSQIASKFEKLFGEYVKVGTFSNGEGVYHKIAS